MRVPLFPKPEVSVDGRGFKVDKKLESERNRKKYLRRKRKKSLAAKQEARSKAIAESIGESSKSPGFEDEPSEWDEINQVPEPIELMDEDDDTYTPPTLKETINQYSKKKKEPEIIEEETPTIKPLPAVGTSISNPLDLSGGNHNVFSVVEKLYGDIGYFILSEQILPIKDQTIKLVQLKTDDGRYVNLFVKL